MFLLCVIFKKNEFAYNGQVFAKGGNYSATDELCRNVDRCTNAHFNYRQPAFCKYYVISWLRLIKRKAKYEALNKRIKKRGMEINKIYNENCLDTMAKMPDNFVDLVVTSPPYDNIREYNGYTFEFEKIASELFRIIKDGGILVWVVADSVKNGTESCTSFIQALHFKNIVGFNLHDTMIYRKENYTPLTHKRYEQEFEYMFVFSKGKPKTFNPILIDCIHAGKIIKRSRSTYETGLSKRQASDEQPKPTGDKKQKGNVWSYKVGGGKTVNHVAQFPLQLATDHITSWSNENDLVYDCFMGGGTTAIAAINNKRKYIGSEISEDYCKIIETRIKECGGLFFNSFQTKLSNGAGM